MQHHGYIKTMESDYVLKKKHGTQKKWTSAAEAKKFGYRMVESAEFVKDQQRGTVTRWSSRDGVKLFEGVMENWKCISCRSWNLDGKLSSEVKRNKETSYFVDGKTASQGRLHPKTHEKVGQWTEWYENGQMKRRGAYASDGGGERAGKWTSWYSNGKKKKQGNYVGPNESGEWTYWADDGSKSAVRQHHSAGPEMRWYENGQLYSKGRVDKAGHACGRQQCWDADGKPDICEFLTEREHTQRCELTEAGGDCQRCR